jgi:putative peptidoglycan lipid II flippase
MDQNVTKKKRRSTIFNVATLLIATSIFGQLLGFLRTKLVSANFPLVGPGSTDAYFAAFTIPDLFFYTISAGALGVAFMPVLSDYLHRHDRRAVWRLTASFMNMLVIVMVVVAVVILIFAKPLMHYIVAPGLSPQQLNNAAEIMRLLAINPLLFTISGVLTSVQQTLGRFFFFAIAPIFYNLSIIASIFVFRHSIGIVGLGVGALIGAVLQLIVVIIGLYGLNFFWHPKIEWGNRDFRFVLKNLPPRSLDQGMDQLEDVVETHIASGLGSGSISNFNYAYTLSTAPILLLGTTIATAAFPKLNARLSQGRPDLYRRDFLKVVRVMVWLAAPVVVLCYFCRGYLARIIFSSGNAQISTIFGFLTVAIFFRILYAIISRWYYSHKDTMTPMYVSIFTIAFNVVLAITLARPNAYGVAGLAIAQSIVAATEVIILTVIMIYHDRKLLDVVFWSGIVRIISVTGFTVLAGFIMISLMPLGLLDRGVVTLGSKLLIITGVTLVVHLIISSLFDLEESRPIIAFIRRIALKPIKIELT